MTARTLVLTSWYFPHKIVCWQDAITLMYLGKVDVVASYDEEDPLPVHDPADAGRRAPQAHDPGEKHGVKFSRMNVYLRDDFTCAYCEKRFVDVPAHVRPRAAALARWPDGVGQHRDRLPSVQREEGKQDARPGRDVAAQAAGPAEVAALRAAALRPEDGAARVAATTARRCRAWASPE